MKITKKTQRGKRGGGYLFKRGADGKTHPADWTGAGRFWIAYRLGGKLIRQRLADAHGNAITDRAQAEAERRRILAPLQTGNELETLKAIQSKIAQAEAQHVEAVAASRNGITIESAWERYLASTARPDTGDATLRQYSFQFARFADWMKRIHSEVATLDGVTREQAQEYAADLAAAGLSGNSFNKHIGLLSLVFRILMDDAGLSANPWEKIARRKHRSAERRELTVEELRRIVTTATGEMRLLYALGIYSGMRLGDCCTLRWTEVDLAQRVIVRIPRKTASKNKPVRIPMFPDLEAMLKEARQSAVGEFVLPELAAWYLAGRGDSITDRIQRHFWNCGIECHAEGTGKQIKRDAVGNAVLTEYGNAVLIDTGKRAVIRCGFHSLRHTFVSLCRAANAPLSVVEAIVGHSNPAMTRHYSHTGDSEAQRAIAALPAITAVEPIHSATREPLPAWARERLAAMTSRTWKAIQAELIAAAD